MYQVVMQTKQGVRTVLTVYQGPIRTRQDRLCVISVHRGLIRIRKVTFRESCVLSLITRYHHDDMMLLLQKNVYK